MWLKLLYFFRVYKSTGYLIRMIAKVVYGMRTFLMVLAITILAVADSFISIAEFKQEGAPENEEEEVKTVGDLIYRNFGRFLTSAFTTYQMILGGDGFAV